MVKRFLIQIIFRQYSKEGYVLFCLFVVGLLLLISFNLFSFFGEQHFVLLAKSLLRGEASLGKGIVTTDGSYFNGFTFWPQGILPAILLTPFVSLSTSLHQGHLQFILNIVNLVLLYKIAMRLTKRRFTALWLAFAYVFSTVYLVVGLIPWSWWYAQIVATTALLFLVYEYLYQRRWFLMGVYLTAAMATRIDLVLATFFPLFLLFASKEKNKLAQFFLFVSPILFGLAGIALYNEVRFGSIYEFGYTYHIPAIASAAKMLVDHGTWSLFYIPTNFYYLFLKGFDVVTLPGTTFLTFPFLSVNPWGMSIFLTSPILFWCLKRQKMNKIAKVSAVTALLLIIFLLGFFGSGVRQYGYRYALDFQPFLFVLLCFAFQKRMGLLPKIVIIASFLFNLLLFSGIFIQPV